ncbi:hypothetical protein niasHT_017501 [Heterodera trifolii]|uniref:Clathrin/coatomer adaptor adaptin-like N-terminal domain-containing protein n=1 Tax=Heterodera trifolii TaxID=157864 RepID=A0ABD2L633_9BILA
MAFRRARLQVLGYDISWTAFNIIEVMSSTRYSEKRIGYLAAVQAFNDETDVLMLTTNLIRKDLQSSNIYDVGVALSGLSCFTTTDLVLDTAENATLAYIFFVDNNGIACFSLRLYTRAFDVFAVRRTVCHRISSLSNICVPFTRADELVHQQLLGYIIDSVPHRALLEVEPDTPLMRRFCARLVRRQKIGIGTAPLEDAQRQEDEMDPLQLAERFKSAGFESNGHQQQQEGIKEEAEFVNKNNNNSLAQPLVGILLSPGPIKQWPLSAALSSAVRPFSHFRALFRLLPSLRRGHPFLAHLSALAPDSLLFFFILCCCVTTVSSADFDFREIALENKIKADLYGVNLSFMYALGGLTVALATIIVGIICGIYYFLHRHRLWKTEEVDANCKENRADIMRARIDRRGLHSQLRELRAEIEALKNR